MQNFIDSQFVIQAVWQKARAVHGFNPAVIRKDSCGAWIQYNHYGNTNSPYGWEIDHVTPISHGGLDTLSNLQALQWQNNRTKSDNYPLWSCAVSAHN